ncbi:gamma-glutamyl hydrolase 2-like [Phalaenopsis equestris]|uniref:gamma-glutamyl hydrolase 2-like n=1 Tax=Phalaenopsis equestris TaxID=78828 RepID=UPI0009E5B91E|nr:gamma-glutamyl hydrolase 2-like [Phalaenopsis equestris]XP_020581283.1 gamma-glutamyl hydrolase 2-like [Phalaenopsis equestris]
MWRFLLASLLIAFSISAAASASSSQPILSPGEEWANEQLRHGAISGEICPSPDPSLYYQPVIGIVTHPGDGATGRLSNSTDASNIPASYVKFIESAGARVIPLIYNEPWDIISDKLELVNGILFTGGWAKEGLYFETVKKVFEFTLARNDAGDHFPLFAICLGFELISMIISQDHAICEHFKAQNQASTLQFANISDIGGSVFERFPPELLRKLSSECLAMENHREGLSPRRLQANDALSSFFKILTTSTDENNEVYVSTAKAYNYPITCFQWHPEKNAFEWGSSMIPHTEDAVRVTQLLANYFISEARKSPKRPPAQKVRDNLIYNYNPTYGGKAGKGFDQVYNFDESYTA